MPVQKRCERIGSGSLGTRGTLALAVSRPVKP